MKYTHPQKAYNNLDFLNSPQARSIRILSEFFEPMKRFREYGIRDTIVIFGSARVKPMKEIKKIVSQIRAKLRNAKGQSRPLERKLEKALNDLEMAQYYEDATRIAYLLTQWSKRLNSEHHFVICSGGGPGIMEAANKGAYLAGGASIGLNISLPFEQQSNRYISKGLGFEFHYFFMRKFWFVYLAKALVMFPGGFGTLDELMEVLTLMQTKKVRKKLPIVLYGRKYWNEVLNVAAMARYGTISGKDARLIRYADTPEEAFHYLRKELQGLIRRRANAGGRK